MSIGKSIGKIKFDDIVSNAFVTQTFKIVDEQKLYTKPDVNKAYKLFNEYIALKKAKSDAESVGLKLAELHGAVKDCVKNKRSNFKELETALEGHPLLKSVVAQHIHAQAPNPEKKTKENKMR